MPHPSQLPRRPQPDFYTIDTFDRMIFRVSGSTEVPELMLEVGDETFVVHAAFVSSKSPFFGRIYAQFKREVPNPAQNKITIHESNPLPLRLLLEYFYSGRFKMPPANTKPMLQLVYLYVLGREWEVSDTYLYNLITSKIHGLLLAEQNVVRVYNVLRTIDSLDKKEDRANLLNIVFAVNGNGANTTTWWFTETAAFRQLCAENVEVALDFMEKNKERAGELARELEELRRSKKEKEGGGEEEKKFGADRTNKA